MKNARKSANANRKRRAKSHLESFTSIAIKLPRLSLTQLSTSCRRSTALWRSLTNRISCTTLSRCPLSPRATCLQPYHSRERAWLTTYQSASLRLNRTTRWKWKLTLSEQSWKKQSTCFARRQLRLKNPRSCSRCLTSRSARCRHYSSRTRV